MDAPAIEVNVRAEVLLVRDDQTRGGGLGPGLELRYPLPYDLWLEAGASALMLSGPIYTADAALALRLRTTERWQPEVGLGLWWAGGALVRTIDTSGRVAGDPLALQLTLAPLQFVLSEGRVSFLAVRAGPVLDHSGTPPFFAALTLMALGW